jgi:hypothetical protein
VTDLPPTLARLGDALEAAAADDLRWDRIRAAEVAPAPPRRQRSARRRRLLAAAAVAIVAVPGAALAADRLLRHDPQEVAASMPAGAVIFGGRTPTCTVVEADVEYRCTLDRPPLDWTAEQQGAVYNTTDANGVVNGGCRNVTADGLVWRCYIGEEAVRQEIIGPDFLGQTVEGPSVG